MKKNLLSLALILFVLMALVAPVQAATSPAPTSKKVFTLKWAHHTTPSSSYAKAADWFLSEVEKRTNGQVKFERYWSASLGPGKEYLEIVNSGVADAAIISGFYSPGKTPLLDFGKSACLFKHQYEGLKAFYDLITQTSAMRDELARYNVRIMSTTGTSSQGIMTTKKELKTLQDLKGLKLRAGGPQAEVMQEFGVVPINLSGPEIFDSMNKGTIDGAVYNPAALQGYGIHDTSKYYYDLPLGGSLSILGIRVQTWNKLPADVQKVFMDVANEHPAAHQRIYEIEGDGIGLKAFADKGIKVIPASSQDAALVQAAARKSWDIWAADMDKRGLPGTKIVDTFLGLVKKYAVQNPDFK